MSREHGTHDEHRRHHRHGQKPEEEEIDYEALEEEEERKGFVKQSQFREVLKRLVKNPTATIGLGILLVLILIAVFAPLIAPYSSTAMDYSAIIQSPSAKHIFGTDDFGRDVFSRCVYGARYSITLGFTAAIVGTVIGTVIGVAVGYAGGQVDNVVMRFCDIWSALPGNLIIIILASVIGRGYVQTIFAMTLGGIPGKIRQSRAMALKEREMEYLESAVSINCSKAKIIYKHMLPNILSPFIVSLAMGIGGQIMSAAGLSYIGLGVQQPTPEWGAMLSGARNHILDAPYLLLFPGICIALTVLSVNLFGDGLRDALDPKLKE